MGMGFKVEKGGKAYRRRWCDHTRSDGSAISPCTSELGSRRAMTVGMTNEEGDTSTNDSNDMVGVARRD